MPYPGAILPTCPLAFTLSPGCAGNLLIHRLGRSMLSLSNTLFSLLLLIHHLPVLCSNIPGPPVLVLGHHPSDLFLSFSLPCLCGWFHSSVSGQLVSSVVGDWSG